MTNLMECEMQMWLLKIKKNIVSERTFVHTLSVVKRYIYPYLGHIAVADVDRKVAQAFYDDFLYREKGVSYETMRKILQPLNSFFDYKVESGCIEENPFRAVSIARYKPFYKPTINTDDMTLFFEAINKHRFWKPFCYTILFTGMRTSEILALKWGDIDFKAKTICIERRIIEKFNFDDNGNTIMKSYAIVPLKKSRKIPMWDLSETILKNYKKYRRQREYANKYKYSYTADDALVFGNRQSELRSYSGITHNLRKFLRRYDLEHAGITFIALRRYLEGMSIEAVDDLYQRLITPKDRQAAFEKKIHETLNRRSKKEILQM